MSTRKPLALISGKIKEMPSGDTVDPAYLPASGGYDGLVREYDEDFIAQNGALPTQWELTNSGAGTGATPWAYDSAKHIGGVSINIGSGFFAGIRLWGSNNGINPADGAIDMEWLVKTPSVAPGGAEDWAVWFGLMGTNDYTADTMAFLVESGRIDFYLKKGASTQTYQGPAVSTNTWYRLRFVTNSAQTAIQVYINGSLVTTITPNFTWSSGSNNMTMQAFFQRWGGTTGLVAKVDRVYFKQSYSSY